MSHPAATPPRPINEPVRTYAPKSPERAALKAALGAMSSTAADIPMVIGGREERTGRTSEVRAPHNKSLLLGQAHEGNADHARRAIDAALAARPAWAAFSQAERSAIFLKAAELAASTWRYRLNAATMLGQS